VTEGDVNRRTSGISASSRISRADHRALFLFWVSRRGLGQTLESQFPAMVDERNTPSAKSDDEASLDLEAVFLVS
jgi:hypothetical protein